MKKLMLLALAAVGATLFALPVAASAETWQIDWNNGNHAAPLKFKTKSGAVSLTTTAGDSITCQSSSGEGQYNTTTTGTTSLLFHSCKGPLGTTCTTSGRPSGTIQANTLSVHNVWVNKHGVRTRGVLLKPTAGVDFATFDCTLFGLGPKMTVTGNGVIGEVELTAACNTPASVAHLNFQSSQAGHQTITKLWNTEPNAVWDLTADKNGVPSTASQDGTGSIEFAQAATATC